MYITKKEVAGGILEKYKLEWVLVFQGDILKWQASSVPFNSHGGRRKEGGEREREDKLEREKRKRKGATEMAR